MEAAQIYGEGLGQREEQRHNEILRLIGANDPYELASNVPHLIIIVCYRKQEGEAYQRFDKELKSVCVMK